MSLSNNIMNLQTIMCRSDLIDLHGEQGMLSYKEGHRDARHAAAELALKADAKIAAMRNELEQILTWLEQGDVEPSFADSIRNLLNT